MTANERQVGGDHYKTGGDELWDLFGPGALAFYACRYVQRWRKKNGVQDLEKALHICDKLREVVTESQYGGCGAHYLVLADDRVEAWSRNSGMDWVERKIVHSLMYWEKVEDIEEAIAGIKYLIEREGFNTTLQSMTLDAARERRVPRYEMPKYDVMPDPPWERKYHCSKCAKEIDGPSHYQTHDTNGTQHYHDTDECRPFTFTNEEEKERGIFSPWQIDRETLQRWCGSSAKDHAIFHKFYKQVTPTVHRLEPYVEDVVPPLELARFYERISSFVYLIKIDLVPTELLRGYFPNILTKQNAVGHGELPEWQQDLYEWSGEYEQYRLKNPAWHVEDK